MNTVKFNEIYTRKDIDKISLEEVTTYFYKTMRWNFPILSNEYINSEILRVFKNSMYEYFKTIKSTPPVSQLQPTNDEEVEELIDAISNLYTNVLDSRWVYHKQASYFQVRGYNYIETFYYKEFKYVRTGDLMIVYFKDKIIKNSEFDLNYLNSILDKRIFFVIKFTHKIIYKHNSEQEYKMWNINENFIEILGKWETPFKYEGIKKCYEEDFILEDKEDGTVDIILKNI